MRMGYSDRRATARIEREGSMLAVLASLRSWQMGVSHHNVRCLRLGFSLLRLNYLLRRSSPHLWYGSSVSGHSVADAPPRQMSPSRPLTPRSGRTPPSREHLLRAAAKRERRQQPSSVRVALSRYAPSPRAQASHPADYWSDGFSSDPKNQQCDEVAEPHYLGAGSVLCETKRMSGASESNRVPCKPREAELGLAGVDTSFQASYSSACNNAISSMREARHFLTGLRYAEFAALSAVNNNNPWQTDLQQPIAAHSTSSVDPVAASTCKNNGSTAGSSKQCNRPARYGYDVRRLRVVYSNESLHTLEGALSTWRRWTWCAWRAELLLHQGKAQRKRNALCIHFLRWFRWTTMSQKRGPLVQPLKSYRDGSMSSLKSTWIVWVTVTESLLRNLTLHQIADDFQRRNRYKSTVSAWRKPRRKYAALDIYHQAPSNQLSTGAPSRPFRGTRHMTFGVRDDDLEGTQALVKKGSHLRQARYPPADPDPGRPPRLNEIRRRISSLLKSSS